MECSTPHFLTTFDNNKSHYNDRLHSLVTHITFSNNFTINLLFLLDCDMITCSGGARIRVEGGQNLYKIYAFYAHISYVFKKKKK